MVSTDCVGSWRSIIIKLDHGVHGGDKKKIIHLIFVVSLLSNNPDNKKFCSFCLSIHLSHDTMHLKVLSCIRNWEKQLL